MNNKKLSPVTETCVTWPVFRLLFFESRPAHALMPCGVLSGEEPGFSMAVKKIGCLVEAFHNEGSRNNTVVCWSSEYLVERLVGLTDSTLSLCIIKAGLHSHPLLRMT